MARQNWWIGAALAVCGTVGLGSTPAESADSIPQATTQAYVGRQSLTSSTGTVPKPIATGAPASTAKVVTSPAGAAPGTVSTGQPAAEKKPSTPREAFEQRIQAAATQQRQREFVEQQQKALAERNRPTAWQFQNPSGPTNRTPTDNGPNGPLAQNNYFGQQFRTWSNLSAPVSMNQLPFNQTATTPVLQSSVPIAPNNYYGPGFARWNQIETSQGRMNPLGGWDYR